MDAEETQWCLFVLFHGVFIKNHYNTFLISTPQQTGQLRSPSASNINHCFTFLFLLHHTSLQSFEDRILLRLFVTIGHIGQITTCSAGWCSVFFLICYLYLFNGQKPVYSSYVVSVFAWSAKYQVFPVRDTVSSWCVGRNGLVVCLVEAQYYNTPESRTITCCWNKAACLYLFSNMTSYTVYRDICICICIWGQLFLRNLCMSKGGSNKSVTWDDGQVPTSVCFYTGAMFIFVILTFDLYLHRISWSETWSAHLLLSRM